MNKILKKKATGVLAQIIANPQKEIIARTQNRMSIALKIGFVLRQKKITQKAFAKIMNKTESEISDWLSGDRNFTIDTLTDISETLGVGLLDTSMISLYHIPSTNIYDSCKKERSVLFYTCNKWSETEQTDENFNNIKLKIS